MVLVAAEAAVEDVIALIQEGDSITIDTPPRLLQLNISDEELARCRANWQPAALR